MTFFISCLVIQCSNFYILNGECETRDDKANPFIYKNYLFPVHENLLTFDIICQATYYVPNNMTGTEYNLD